MFPVINRPERPERGLLRRVADPFGLLRDEVDSLLDRFMSRMAMPDTWLREHRVWEVEEADREVVYRMELPGFEAGEIDLTVTGNDMMVRAEHRPAEAPGAEKKEEAEPRRHALYELTVTLPAGLNPDKVEASHRNGVLEVHVPRMPGFVPRRVEVRT